MRTRAPSSSQAMAAYRVGRGSGLGRSSARDYRFVTTWEVDSTPEEVSDVLSNVEDLVRWWPDVYLDVIEVEPGDDRGVGKVVALHTKGWLPYTLHWTFRVTESRYPLGFSLEAWGDLAGSGVWEFTSTGRAVVIRYDWRVRAEKPLLRYLSWLLKPLFSFNHRWAMKKGEESLRRELTRRKLLRRTGPTESVSLGGR